LFNGRPKARCYPFNIDGHRFSIDGHRFRDKNPQVTYNISDTISYTIWCTTSYALYLFL
jgi:hypothetical protein